jgi:hypothetical protein
MDWYSYGWDKLNFLYDGKWMKGKKANSAVMKENNPRKFLFYPR